MARYKGNATAITFNSVALEGDYRQFGHTEEAELIDGSAGADTRKTWLTGLIDEEFTLSGLDDSTRAEYDALAVGTSASLVWGPRGNTTGYQRYTATAIVTNREETGEYNGMVAYSATLKITSAPVEDTY